MYLFFDTETNGKALNFKAPVHDLNNWPRITQLGWQLYDKDEKLISEHSILIKPDGWEIPTEKFFIDNNMSTERCEESGIPLKEAIELFLKDAASCEYIIAHNMAFDKNVIGAEYIRLDITAPTHLKEFCTMNESTNVCKIPGFRGYKWPTLTELHRHLFQEGFDGAHDAGADTAMCSKSFFELKKLGHILKG